MINMRHGFKKLHLKILNAFGQKYFIGNINSSMKMRVRTYDLLALPILLDSFENELNQVFNTELQQGMTVLDIGANIGYYTIKFASKIGCQGKVFAFEPNPIVSNELNFNIKLNNLSNVSVEKIALSNKNEKTNFEIPSEGREAHGSFKKNSTFHSVGQIEVYTETLDSIITEKEISKIDFIKIDVEGAELYVFQGATELLKQKKTTILFECAENLCLPFGHRVFDVLSYVNSFGYEIKQISYGNWLAKPKN